MFKIRSIVLGSIIFISCAASAWGEEPTPKDGGNTPSPAPVPSEPSGRDDRARTSKERLTSFVEKVILTAPDDVKTIKDELETANTLIDLFEVQTKADADKDKAVAEEKATTAEAKADEAKAVAANLRSGKLLQYGVTGGVGFAVQIPLDAKSESNKFSATDDATVGALPYVALFPGYWSQAAATNKYCASEWSVSASEAQVAADAIARSQAAPLVDSLLHVYRAGPEGGNERVTNWIKNSDEYGRLRPHESRVVELIQNHETGAGDQKKSARRALEDLVSAEVIDWSPGVPTSCWRRRFGLFVGVPLAHSLGFEYDGKSVGDFDVDAGVAGGLVFAPNAYVTILLGVSYATADLSATDADAHEIKETVDLLGLMVSIGGTLDLAAIFKEL